MKNFIKKTVSFFNKLLLRLKLQRRNVLTGSYFKVGIQMSKGNKIDINHSKLERVEFNISGGGNIFHSKEAFISKTTININGQDNKVTLQPGVNLRNSIVIIRGNNCSISIGSDTTFGGIRIVNVGESNRIEIGKNCLFSDNIELWASDTHPIYDMDGNLINKEKPVSIGDNVWVGCRVTILKGVKVGDGSVLGMGSVVLNDVDPGAISAGYPNKTIKTNISWKRHHK